jgi:putative flippase GtrA
MLSARVWWFLVVGTAAAAVHFGVVIALVSWARWPPLWANPAAWLVAFVVSYAGHRTLTFADAHAPRARSLRRFFVVSALGFVVNHAAYAWLLTQHGLEYRVALAAVLVAVAVLSFTASRRWAFLGSPAAAPHRAAPPTDRGRG